MRPTPDRASEPRFSAAPVEATPLRGARPSARLLRPQRDPGAAPARAAEPAEDLPPRLSLSADDRMILPSRESAAEARGGSSRGPGRLFGSTIVILFALYGAYSLAHQLYDSVPVGVLQLAHLR